MAAAYESRMFKRNYTERVKLENGLHENLHWTLGVI